ncbi:hypothetical protein [Cryobacterium mannosilyticum]|uniref:Uncharacterized protein n=1 Tax=Cryobacterium mannosilyticum TaxID=1259190 RepID=A0A4V3ICW7_9MICO|nr:hypothetical protein [Cryobacterium mannosilyticum]TFC03632.1 hypothetical protein E3O32_10045 [Cryobacterium mannosilyticum]
MITTVHEKALACLAGQNEGEVTEYRTKEPINLNKNTSVTSTTARVTTTPKAQAWLDGLFDRLKVAPVTVATAAGFVVKPDSLLLKSLCNADEARHIDRARFAINAGVSL